MKDNYEHEYIDYPDPDDPFAPKPESIPIDKPESVITQIRNWMNKFMSALVAFGQLPPLPPRIP